MWMWTLGALALAGEPHIAVSGPGEVLISASDNPVFIAPCRGVQWELFNPDTNDFEPAVLPACEETKPAHQIDTNGQLFSLTAMLPPIPPPCQKRVVQGGAEQLFFCNSGRQSI